jgi:exopolysaccharide biosynthesis polyprenyl glycosylphosphotransferase
MQSPLRRSFAGAELAGGNPAPQVAALTPRHAWERTALVGTLVLADAMSIAGAFTLAYLLRFKANVGAFYDPPDSPLRFYSTLVFWLVPLVLAMFAVYRLYALDRLFAGFDEYVRVLSAGTLSIIAVIFVSFLLDERLVISRAWILIYWAMLLTTVAAGRFLMRRLVYRLRLAGHLTKRVIVLGGGAQASELAQHLHGTTAGGLQVAGILDPQAIWGDEPVALGAGLRLRHLIAGAKADAVVVSAASVPQSTLARIVRELANLPTELHLVPGMYEILTTGVEVREVRGLPLVTMNKVRITGYDRIVKQMLDYTVATLALLALSPILFGIALAVRLTSPGPIFHRRRVVGQCGRRFDALKFRTMYVDGDAILAQHPELAERLARDGKLKDDPRLTPIGGWLRRWSLDEFPQLLNVLRGQMSLVGPRMISETELDRFGHWRQNLSTVKPGLTGLWQVSGRSNLGYDDRVRLDMHYIRNYSIWSDLEILARTIPAVLAGDGAY